MGSCLEMKLRPKLPLVVPVDRLSEWMTFKVTRHWPLKLQSSLAARLEKGVDVNKLVVFWMDCYFVSTMESASLLF